MKAEYITHMGDDLLVVNSARVSFDKESALLSGCWNCDWRGEHPGTDTCPACGEDNAGWERKDEQQLAGADARLIGYLARHNHWTPFSHPQITLRETVPIFVARQRFKHMVGFTYNEVSRRYVDDEPEFFVPEVWRSRPEGSVKQGSGEVHGNSGSWAETAANATRHCLNIYNAMIADGIAPEQARMILPQSMLTSYYVTGSLAAFARAYKQRIDPHAQQEIQQLALQWGEIIEPLFPVSWAALTQSKP